MLSINAIYEARGLELLVDVIKRWSPASSNQETAVQKWDWTSRQELLAKCCYAVWLLCQKNEVNQVAFCEAGGAGGIVGLLHAESDETLLEMAAGAACALCEGCDQNKDRFREEKGLQPLIGLLDHNSDSVKLNSAKALCHLSENEENRRIVREMGGLDRLVKLLSH